MKQLKLKLLGFNNMPDEYINKNGFSESQYSATILDHPDSHIVIPSNKFIRIKATQPDYNWLNTDEIVGNARMGNKKYTIVTNKYFNEIDEDVMESWWLDQWIDCNFHYLSKYNGNNNMLQYALASSYILNKNDYNKVRILSVEIENIYEVLCPYRRYNISVEEL